MKQQVIDAQLSQEEEAKESIRSLWNAFENLLTRSAFNHLHCKIQKKRTIPKNIIHKRRQNLGFHEYSNYYRACRLRRK